MKRLGPDWEKELISVSRQENQFPMKEIQRYRNFHQKFSMGFNQQHIFIEQTISHRLINGVIDQKGIVLNPQCNAQVTKIQRSHQYRQMTHTEANGIVFNTEQ